MLNNITYGERVVTTRQTSYGIYVDLYRVDETTGRTGLKLVTVVPITQWEKFTSPYFISLQLPIESLTTVDEWLRGRNDVVTPLHPAMGIANF